jgi:hypothetical protein
LDIDLEVETTSLVKTPFRLTSQLCAMPENETMPAQSTKYATEIKLIAFLRTTLRSAFPGIETVGIAVLSTTT